MAAYREIAPSPRLASGVECFWTSRCEDGGNEYRVLPDGCADILFTRDGDVAAVQVVGPMTGYRDFPQPAGRVLLGVRFHPGMWTGPLGIPGDRITDATVGLDSLWGARAGQLHERLANAATIDQCVALLESFLPAPGQPGRLDRALACLARSHGAVAIDDLARQSNLSVRQLRRLCLAQTGLSPKFLARVLRFRHALARMHAHPCAFAHLALDCGYYDQAHFIHEFRELSGRTPAANGRFFQSP